MPFNTIEGKTLFLEKSAALVNLVSYPIYQQQLIEGIAQTIGQNTTQVEKAIEQNIANNSQHYYANELEQAEIVNQSFQTKPKRTSPSSIKSLMSRMISCVINYPSLVNDPETSSVIEERARKLPKSDVLVELIRHAQVESDLSKEDPEAWEKVSFTDLCLDGMNDPYANKFKHYHKEIRKISKRNYTTHSSI